LTILLITAILVILVGDLSNLVLVDLQVSLTP